MARKHLINVHSGTKTTEPSNAGLKLGEIAVQHTTEKPALWIKVGTSESSTDYEKFISETEILNIVSGMGGGGAVTAVTISGTGNALVAASFANSALTIGKGNVQEVIDDLTTIRNNALSGASASTRVTSLSAATTGINKTLTDLKSSAVTSVKLNGTAYTGNSVDLGTVITSETQLSTGTPTGTGNVVTNLNVNNHQITLVKSFSAAPADLFVTLSGAAHNKITSLSAATTGINKTITDLENSAVTSVKINDTTHTGNSIDLGSVITEETQLSTGTPTGTGNVVTSLDVNNHQITPVKSYSAAPADQFVTLSGAAHNKITALSAATTGINNNLTALSAATTGINSNLTTLSGAAHNKITSLSAATTAISKDLVDLSDSAVTSIKLNNETHTGNSVDLGELVQGNAKIFAGTCATAGATAGKVVDCPSFTAEDLVRGALIFVTFDKTNSATASALTMDVNETGAKSIKKQYSATTANLSAAGEIRTNSTYLFQYDGTNWVCMTLDFNTTYSSMSVAEYEAGTGTTARLITPARLKGAIQYHAPKADWNAEAGTAAEILNKPDIAGLSAETIALSASVVSNKTNITNLSNSAVTSIKLNGTTKTGNSIDLGNVLTAVIAEGDNYLSAGVTSNSAVSVTTVKPVIADKTALSNVSTTGSFVDALAVKDYVSETLSSSVVYKGSTATLPANPNNGDLWIATAAMTASTKPVEIGDFIIYNGNSSSWDVIQKNLDGAVTGSLTADTITLGDSLHSVKSLANGTKGQVLAISGTNNTPTWITASLTDTATTEEGHYTPGTSASTKGTTAATTSFVKGIRIDSKNHVIDVVTGTVITAQTSISTANGTTGNSAAAVITGITTGGTAGHSLTLNKTNKIFSATTADSANTTLHALSADTVNGHTIEKDVPAAAEFTDTATTQDGHYTPATASTNAGSSTSGSFLKTVAFDSKGHYISAATGSALTSQATASTTNGTTGNTAAAVVTGITTGGTAGHQLTLNKTNKIFSASTADVADAAKKTNSALTINVLDTTGGTASTVTFDGSSNKTLDISIPEGSDTATTETGHYTPATPTKNAGSSTSGRFLKTVAFDSKGHYISGTTGSAIVSETQLSTATTGTGNVMTDITVSNHQITKNMGMTIPDWATASTKPSYTASEVGALPTGTPIAVTALTIDGSGNAVTGATYSNSALTLSKGNISAAVTAVTVSGTGNAVVAATFTNSALTLGKGNVQATISDLSTIRARANSGYSAYTGFIAHSANTDIHVTSQQKTYWTDGANSGASAYTAVTALSAATTGIANSLTALSASVITNETAVGKIAVTAVTINGTGDVITGASYTNSALTLTKGSAGASITGASITSSSTGNSAVIEGGSVKISANTIPNYTTANNDQYLSIVNGVPTWVTPTTVYTGNIAPTSGLGIEGDLYVQSE